MALNLAQFCHSLGASDFSAEMIARAKEKPENLNFTIQDASNLSYKEVPIPKKQGIISAILNGVMRLMKFRLWTAKKYETMLLF